MGDIKACTKFAGLLWPAPPRSATNLAWGVGVYFDWHGIPGAAAGHALGANPASPTGAGGTCQAFASSYNAPFRNVVNPLTDTPVNTLSGAIVPIPAPGSTPFGAGQDPIETAKGAALDSLQAALIAAMVAAGVPVPNSI